MGLSAPWLNILAFSESQQLRQKDTQGQAPSSRLHTHLSNLSLPTTGDIRPRFILPPSKATNKAQPQSWLTLYVTQSPAFAIEMLSSPNKHHQSRRNLSQDPKNSLLTYTIRRSASLASPSHSPRALQSSTAMARSPSRKRPTAVSPPLRSTAPALLHLRVMPLAHTAIEQDADERPYRR